MWKWSGRCYNGSLDFSCLLKENVMICPSLPLLATTTTTDSYIVHQTTEATFSSLHMPKLIMTGRVSLWAYGTVGEVLLNNP